MIYFLTYCRGKISISIKSCNKNFLGDGMKYFFRFIVIVFLTGCLPAQPTWEQRKNESKIDLENSFRTDLNYDLALCESFVKNSKYRFLTSKELSPILYRADMQKDEYETSEQFQERQKKEKSKIAKKIKQKTKSDYILYSNNSLMSYYDADSAKLFIRSHWLPMSLDNGLVEIEMIDDFMFLGSEKMQNAFGATANVSHGAYHQFHIFLAPFSNETLSKYYRRNHLYFSSDEIYWPQANPKEISVGASQAKEFRENLRLLIVADPQNSYYVSGKTEYFEATFSSPVSSISSESRAVLKPITACYYNKKTKEVYSLFNNYYSNIGEKFSSWSDSTKKFHYNENYLKGKGY